MRTDAELDAMHETTVARFPGGLTPVQFRQVTLESADDNEDGRVYPPWIQGIAGNPFIRMSLCFGMLMEGLVDGWDDGSGRPQKHQPATNLKITAKGREWLRTNAVTAQVNEMERK